MKKFVALLMAGCLSVTPMTVLADTIDIGDNKIEYDSIEELQKIFTAIKERMASDYKVVLFDADTYDDVSYIVGETFPAGRYYVYPVSPTDEDTLYSTRLYWWNKEDIENYSCTDYICAHWKSAVTLTEGMKIQFDWLEYTPHDMCIAMQKVPDSPTNLMNIFD